MNKKIKVNIFIPVHSTEVLARHATWEALFRTGQYNIQEAFQSQTSTLRAEETADSSEAELPKKIAIMENEIAKGYYDISNKIPIEIPE